MDMRRHIKLFTLLLSLAFSNAYSQECYPKPTGDKGLAGKYFDDYQNYGCALKEYLMVYSKKPNDPKINRRVAQCYLRMAGGNKGAAVKYLKFLTTLKKVDNEVYLELGQAYLYAGSLDEAIANFKKYITLEEPNDEELAKVNKFIEYANNGKQLKKHPVDVKFENMGDEINGEYNEYLPYASINEDFIIFSTNRKGTMGGFELGDGYYPDVYLGKLKRNRDKYSKARSIGGMFNSEYSEEVAGGSSDGCYFFFNTDVDYQILNLKVSYRAPRKRSYPNPVLLDGINEKNSNEIAATITNDGSLIIFASDRKGGYGGYDLWMSKKLPTGAWGIPVNMGPTINTEFNELYPMFNHTQSSIYFSSNGHFSIGGFDLYETTFSEDLKIWTSPRNLGYPVNTAYDDFNICYNASGRNAYKSMVRDDSFGMMDIYRLTFGDAIPTYTVVKSHIYADSTINITELLASKENEIQSAQGILDSMKIAGSDSLTIDSLANIINQSKVDYDLINPNTLNEIEATINGQLYGRYRPNAKTGKFIMILEPGIYDITVNNEGYQPAKMKIKILDKSNFVPQLVRDFYLTPQEKK